MRQSHATTTPLTRLSIQADGHLLARVQRGQSDKGIADAAQFGELELRYDL